MDFQTVMQSEKATASTAMAILSRPDGGQSQKQATGDFQTFLSLESTKADFAGPKNTGSKNTGPEFSGPETVQQGFAQISLIAQHRTAEGASVMSTQILRQKAVAGDPRHPDTATEPVVAADMSHMPAQAEQGADISAISPDLSAMDLPRLELATDYAATGPIFVSPASPVVTAAISSNPVDSAVPPNHDASAGHIASDRIAAAPSQENSSTNNQPVLSHLMEDGLTARNEQSRQAIATPVTTPPATVPSTAPIDASDALSPAFDKAEPLSAGPLPEVASSAATDTAKGTAESTAKIAVSPASAAAVHVRPDTGSAGQPAQTAAAPTASAYEATDNAADPSQSVRTIAESMARPPATATAVTSAVATDTATGWQNGMTKTGKGRTKGSGPLDALQSAGATPRMSGQAQSVLEALSARHGQPVPGDDGLTSQPPLPLKPLPAAAAFGMPMDLTTGEDATLSGTLNPVGGSHNAHVATGAIGPATGKLPAHSPTMQVGLGIAKAVGDGTTRFTIRMDPPELGRIEVKLDMLKNGGMRALIVADSPETLDLLQRDARSLERMLADSGIKADGNSLSFSLNQQTRDQQMAAFADMNRQQDDRSRNSGDYQAGEDSASFTHDPEHQTLQWYTGDGLNIVI